MVVRQRTHEGGQLEWEGQTLSARVAFELVTELKARHGGASEIKERI